MTSSTSISFQILCPCSCGEAVTMTDAGFSATSVEVAACSSQSSRGIASLTFRKSEALSFAAARPAALRHRSGLVEMAG